MNAPYDLQHLPAAVEIDLAEVAAQDIKIEAELRDLIVGYQPEIYGDLARVFRNLSAARRGEQIGIDAILASLLRMRDTLIHKYVRTR